MSEPAPFRAAEAKAVSERRERSRIYLLSPANVRGGRARQVLGLRSKFDLAQRLRNGGASLGEVFCFISQLYFRGKLAYAKAFAAPPRGAPGSLVITPSGGLVPPERACTRNELRAITRGDVDERRVSYRAPLVRDAQRLAAQLGEDCEVVLLGSIATPKYTEPLLEVFGPQLLFPAEFVGRGDMSRGGLLLRCAQSDTRLTYIPVQGALRHGAKPPRLPRLPRRDAVLSGAQTL